MHPTYTYFLIFLSSLKSITLSCSAANRSVKPIAADALATWDPPLLRMCTTFNVSNGVLLDLWQRWYQDFSLLGIFAPRSESSHWELSLPGTKVFGNFRSEERKLSGTFAPGSESSRELLFPGAKVPGNFRSRDSQFTFLPDNYSLVMKITLITLITRRRKTIQVCYRRCLQ